MNGRKKHRALTGGGGSSAHHGSKNNSVYEVSAAERPFWNFISF